MTPISWLWIYLLLVFGATLWLATLVFRHGARRQYITSIPFGRLLFLSVGLQLFGWVFDRTTVDPDAKSLLQRLAQGAFIFAVGAVIWLAGLFYGRWRDTRRDGVLKRR